MGENDQVRPLAPASDRIASDEEVAVLESTKLRQRRCIKCFGCCMAGMVIQAVVIIVLVFTVFRVRDPKIKMNDIQILQIKLINGTIPDPLVNITIRADVSVKNPNVASFKYGSSNTTLFYHGNVVGEARTPAGQARPQRTQRMNVTVEMITAKLLVDPNLKSDVSSGLLTMTSYTRIGGRVKIINIIKKHVIVRMNCSMTINLTSQTLQEQKCKRRVSL